ncbi:hypothetical protein, partial [Caldisalinibacter kiritimatiensis]|uniref:hypothetical protein n=1 Tax=Caldisalinibacter kiritimatiensis TaxID=1304284 RepID=UPI000554780E
MKKHLVKNNIKKIVSLIIIFIMVFSNITSMYLPNILNNKVYATSYPSNQAEFEDMVQKAGFPNTDLNYGLSPNFQLYQERGIIVYGSPEDVKRIEGENDERDGEYRYLG